MGNKINISKEGYLDLLEKVFQNKTEERELALDRFREADEQMDSAEAFVLMGKNAVSFLTLASNSTSDIANIAKEIKSIVYSDASPQNVNLHLDDGFKDKIMNEIVEFEDSKKQKDKE